MLPDPANAKQSEEEKTSIIMISSLPISFKCAVCERTYSDETDLLLHVRGLHHAESNQEALRSFRYVCPVCSKCYRLTDDLVLHIGSMHRKCLLDGIPRVESFKCPVCNYNFATRLRYETHRCIRRIQGFSCDVCHKKFLTQGLAKRHCGKQKPFLCQHCGQRFKIYKHLWTHVTNCRLKKQISVAENWTDND